MRATDNPYQQLIDCLIDDGLVNAARKLDHLYRHVVWSTQSEFRSAFEAEMTSIKAAYWPRMSESLRRVFIEIAKGR